MIVVVLEIEMFIFFQDYDNIYEEALNTSWATSVQASEFIFTQSSNFVDTDCTAVFFAITL